MKSSYSSMRRAGSANEVSYVVRPGRPGSPTATATGNARLDARIRDFCPQVLPRKHHRFVGPWPNQMRAGPLHFPVVEGHDLQFILLLNRNGRFPVADKTRTEQQASPGELPAKLIRCLSGRDDLARKPRPAHRARQAFTLFHLVHEQNFQITGKMRMASIQTGN